MSDNLKSLGMFQSVAGDYEAYQQRRADAAKCPMTGMAGEFKPSTGDYLQNPYLFFLYSRGLYQIKFN